MAQHKKTRFGNFIQMIHFEFLIDLRNFSRVSRPVWEDRLLKWRCPDDKVLLVA